MDLVSSPAYARVRARPARLTVPTVVLTVLLSSGCGIGVLPQFGSDGAAESAQPGPAFTVPTPVPPPDTDPSSSPSATPAEPTPSATVPSAEPAPSSPPPAAEDGLTARKRIVRGSSGRLTWRIESYRFSGSSGTGEINRRVRASVQDAIDSAQQNARDDDGRRGLTGRSTLTTNDGRTVQVALVVVDYLEGTARPSTSVGTTAVTADSGDPILLSEVFPDEREAFRALAPEILQAAESKGEPVSDRDGLAPRTANWANWQTSTEGMTFYFSDSQLGGPGLRIYTVPWSVVRPLMSRSAVRLLAPPR